MKKRWIRFSFIAILLIALIVAVCNLIVVAKSQGKTIDSVDDAPKVKLGLVLGTSPYTSSGLYNYSFANRINAAAMLYKSGKVKKLLVSGGDYLGKFPFGCDEPVAMRDSLIAKGVDPNDIFMDSEGTTTIRSIAKLKYYYGYADTVLVISQGYHNRRALMLAEEYGLPALAFDADMPESTLNNLKNLGRESLARVKLFYSIWIAPKLSADNFSSADKNRFCAFLID